MNKTCIIIIAIVLIFFFNIHTQLENINLSINSNNAILVSLRDRASKQLAEEKVEKLKQNIKALNNTPCQTCHIGQTKLLLPIENRFLTYESFLHAIREGNLYMPSYTSEEIGINKLNSIYEILYKEKANVGGGGGGRKGEVN